MVREFYPLACKSALQKHIKRFLALDVKFTLLETWQAARKIQHSWRGRRDKGVFMTLRETIAMLHGLVVIVMTFALRLSNSSSPIFLFDLDVLQSDILFIHTQHVCVRQCVISTYLPR